MSHVNETGLTAFVFPGQGSQTLGMLQELNAHFPVIADVFQSVSNVLDYDVWELTQTGPEDRLNQTEYTQVAMLTADVAVYRVLQQHHIDASLSAGHSLGEYAALVCADAMTLADAARLVQARGRFMQSNVPLGEGAMAAIVGLKDSDVEEICAKISTQSMTVSPANYNAIGQVVIAGHTVVVRAAMKMAEEMGARLALEIPVSVPCHCDLLIEAAKQFEAVLQQTPIKKPQRRVISNVDLSIHESPEAIRALLAKQLYSPVRWVETIQSMRRAGVEYIIECGPGQVLTGLVKRIDKGMTTFNVHTINGINKLLTMKGVGN